jgi:hypothetical protein
VDVRDELQCLLQLRALQQQTRSTHSRIVIRQLQDPEEWQVCGDFKIQLFLDHISRSRSLFWCWHNSAFMTGTHAVLGRESLDKVHRSMPPGVRLGLEWQPGEGTMFPLQSAPQMPARVRLLVGCLATYACSSRSVTHAAKLVPDLFEGSLLQALKGKKGRRDARRPHLSGAGISGARLVWPLRVAPVLLACRACGKMPATCSDLQPMLAVALTTICCSTSF